MGYDLSKAEKAAIVADYLAGRTANAISRDWGFSRVPVEKVLRDAGVYDGSRIRVGAAFLNDQKQQMAEMYAQGMSVAKIGREFNTYPQGVWKILRSMGVDFRKGNDKGGRVKSTGGYISVRMDPADPFASMAIVTGYVLEHRLVMARRLGRPLGSSETVHHINGDKKDNRPENLQLRQGKHGSGVKYVCADCGSHNVVADSL